MGLQKFLAIYVIENNGERLMIDVGEALKELIGLKDNEEKKVELLLKEILEEHRGKVESMEFDKDKNQDFNEELALKNEEKGDDNE